MTIEGYHPFDVNKPGDGGFFHIHMGLPGDQFTAAHTAIVNAHTVVAGLPKQFIGPDLKTYSMIERIGELPDLSHRDEEGKPVIGENIGVRQVI